MKYLAILLLVTTVSACSSKYKTDSYAAPSQSLDANVSVYVMMSEAGHFDDIKYPQSGNQLTNATAAAISLHISKVKQADKIETLEEALSKAKNSGFTHVFQPTIVHWEDRATEWSGRLDRITVKIIVWSSAMKDEISSSVLRASSKWFTLGGDHPEDLLPGAINPYMNQLFDK